MFNKSVALCLGCIAFLLLLASASWGATPLFQPAQTYNLGVSALSITAADVNGDGKLDLLVADGGGSLGVSLGRGDGTSRPPSVTTQVAGDRMRSSWVTSMVTAILT